MSEWLVDYLTTPVFDFSWLEFLDLGSACGCHAALSVVVLGTWLGVGYAM